MTHLWFVILILLTKAVSSGFNLSVALWAGIQPCWERDDYRVADRATVVYMCDPTGTISFPNGV